MEFTDVETKALSLMVEACREQEPALEIQIAKAKVSARENTGVGFFTKLKIDGPVPPLHQSSTDVAHAFAEVAGLEHGMGIILFHQDGIIDEIEFWTVTPARTHQLDPYNLDFEIISVEKLSNAN